MIAAIGLGELLWSLLVLYVIVHVLIATFVVVLDLIRSDDLSGWAKAGWAVVLLFLPMLGLLAYLVLRGDGIAGRNKAEAEEAKAEFDAYVRTTAGTPAIGTELEAAARLRDAGTITDAEFDAIKAKLIGPPAPPSV